MKSFEFFPPLRLKILQRKIGPKTQIRFAIRRFIIFKAILLFVLKNIYSFCQTDVITLINWYFKLDGCRVFKSQLGKCQKTIPGSSNLILLKDKEKICHNLLVFIFKIF